MTSQLVIKALLIASFALVGLIMVVPRTGARPLALRRLSTLLLIVVAILAVINPAWLSQLAALVGVGRGTDLVVYVLAVLFFGHTVASRTRTTQINQQITDLARKLAIAEAPSPSRSAGPAAPVAAELGEPMAPKQSSIHSAPEQDLSSH